MLMEGVMATESEKKPPIKGYEKKEVERSAAMQTWQPFEGLRRQIDRVFEDFDRDFWQSPFRRSTFGLEPLMRRELSSAPAVDIVEKDNAYVLTAELPGMDEKDIHVELIGGGLRIKGEKSEEKEEKKKGYHLQERRFGSFERYFRIPEGVDLNKIEASFSKGVLTVSLPKTPAAQQPERKIEVKAT
jgi:HSP20 family protein